LRVEGFTASVAQSALTAQTGKPVNATVTFQSVNHFKTNSVQVGCKSTSSVTCTMTPYAAVLSDGGTATVQIAITGMYGAGAGDAAPQQRWPTRLPWLAGLLLPLAAVRGRKRMLLCLCLAGICTSLNACGGGQSSSRPPASSQTVKVQLYATTLMGGVPSLQQNIGMVTLTVTE
jgi:hypothetical protein